MGVTLQPITVADAPRVGAFLNAHLNPKVTAEHWARSIDVPWSVEAPNDGFMLLDGDGAIVGAYLAFYSEREIDGRAERFCNLGAWCVREEHRFHSLRLLRALLAQDGYHFTDLSPSGNVVELNRGSGSSTSDTTAALVPNLPWPSRPRRDAISADPAVIERTLTGAELALYRDHADAAAARHIVLIRDGEWCYVVVPQGPPQGPAGVRRVLHVSDPELLRRMARPFARHLLLRHGALATLRRCGSWAAGRGSRVALRSPRQKMFRSRDLEPAQIDYLYSELVCVAW